MKLMLLKSSLLRLSAMLLVFGSIGSLAYSGDSERPLFFTPTTNGQVDVLAGLNSAHSAIHMTMFNLTDPTIIAALIAAKDRGVDVKVLLDKSSAERKVGGAFDQLTAAGVSVRKSTPQFSITHSKSFTIDGKTAFIMTLNLTKISDRVRDVAMITTAGDSVKFVDELFDTDWDNSANGTNVTPANIPEQFVVSPINSKDKIVALLHSATSSLVIEVENLSYDDMIQEMIAAHKRGVTVQVLLPRCNFSNSNFNMPAARLLDQGGVEVRLMPNPNTADTPYIHQKSIVADGVRAFLGSENFSFNSIEHARELGILFDNPLQVKQIADTFTVDFNKSMNYTDANTYVCPKSTFSDDETNELM